MNREIARTSRVAIVLAATIVAAATTAAQSTPASAASSQPVPRTPIHTIKLGRPFGRPFGRGNSAISPDGSTIYAVTTEPAINIWEIAVYYWPEILGGVTGLAVLVALLALRRVQRRPHIIGEPHCRHCNY